jgi:hypothetical protein
MSAADRQKFEQQLQRANEVLQLILKRQELLRSLKEVDQHINSLAKEELKIDPVETPATPAVVETPKVVVAVEATREEIATPIVIKSKRGRKPKGEFSLADSILWLVQDHEEGLTLSEIVEKILQSGYKTSSKDFAGVVASTLSALKANGRLFKTDGSKYIIQKK